MLKSYADNIVPYAGDYCDRTYGGKSGQATELPNIRFIDQEDQAEAAAQAGGARAILRRPPNIPQNIWDRLNQAQKLSRWAREWFRENQQLLTPEERMRIGISLREGVDIDEETLCLVLALERSTARCSGNKTWPAVMSYAQECLDECSPISFALSQCLDKNPALWRATVEDALNLPITRVDSFLEITDGMPGFRPKGWENLQKVRAELAYPSTVTLLIGDQDFFTFGRGENTGTEKAREELAPTIARLKTKTQQDAEKLFGKGQVKVRLWSELYTKEQYEAALRDARATQASWLDPAFKEQMEQYYLGIWGSTYRPIRRALGVTEGAMKDFVRDDTIRLAAQYTLEARILKQRKALQLWGAESTMQPSVCMRVSNYDQRTDEAGSLPPTLTI